MTHEEKIERLKNIQNPTAFICGFLIGQAKAFDMYLDALDHDAIQKANDNSLAWIKAFEEFNNA